MSQSQSEHETEQQSQSRATPHVGGCHCGAVRFEVDLDLTAPVGRCNCTICQKRGATGAVRSRSTSKRTAPQWQPPT